jgi:hypothetical protein
METYHCGKQDKKFYPKLFCRGYLRMLKQLAGIMSVDFNATGQIPSHTL